MLLCKWKVTKENTSTQCTVPLRYQILNSGKLLSQILFDQKRQNKKDIYLDTEPEHLPQTLIL